jgi:dTDP-4-dehydrorhamnose 3,5-epimerase
MIFTPTPLSGSYVIDLELLRDSRGWFARTFCKKEFEEIGHTKEWVQLNHSYTVEQGALRGLHYQVPPFSEIKMVRCVAGSVFDVMVDLRKDSATFLQWFGIELSAANKKMMYIPEGFAHGFQTLQEHSELIYHHSEFYTPGAEKGLRFNDPKINIQWPAEQTAVSERDQQHPLLNDNFTGI